MTQPRVFVSAASDEFRPLRERLAALLLRSGINVEHQEIFPQTTSDTVRKLGDLIQRCPLLVHIVGHIPGAVAHPAAVADLLDGIPAGQFLSRFDDLRQQLGDFSGLTYTQWEAMLALHHGVPMLVYAPADARDPGTRTVLDTFAQKAHHDRLRLARKYAEFCRDEAEFVGKILADVHRHLGIVPAATKPQNLPYPSLGTLFKGRADFLAQVQAQLAHDRATVIRGRQAIHGMGGVGKTRAAVEYAWEHADDYRALLFVTADSADALERNLAALCGPLILNLPEQDARETAAQVSAVVRWLNQHPGWFLVIDNVDTPEAQAAVTALLASIGDGHVVITSRLADWPAGVTELDLDVLSEESSIAFLLERTEDRRSRRPDDAKTAAQIVRMLDRLALALEQCAAYIRHRRCALVDYLSDWEGKRAAVLSFQDAQKSHYPRSLAVTYETTVAQLSEGARELFRMLSWIAPDPMPIWAVEKIPGLTDPRALLVELADLHLARLSPDGTTCTVHRLLQEITRQQQPEARPPSLIAALEWVNREYPLHSGDVRFWPIATPLTPHGIVLANAAADRDILEPSARLLNQAALYFSAKANFRAAEPLMRRALAGAEASPGHSHPTLATRLVNLAELLQGTSRFDEAEPLLRRALAIDEARYGDSHPEVASDLNNLGQLLQDTGRWSEAEAVMRRALAIDEATLGESDPTVAIRLSNLAHLLHSTGRSGEAEPLMQRALTIDEANFGGSHPRVSIHLNNLAQLLDGTKRYDAAEPLMRRALAIDEASLGAWHPSVAIRLNNLARLLQKTNRLGDAEPLMRRHLEIFLAFARDTGHPHPNISTAVNNYGGLLLAIGDTTEQAVAKIRAIAAQYGVDLGAAS